MTIDVRHLRGFLAIAEEGNLTRAAARLHITQPALSRTLQQLEAHLGGRLVDRSTHHLVLTPAGHAFRRRAAAAVAAVDHALDPAQSREWPVRLGHAWSALGAHTTTLLRRWKQRHPETHLELLRVDDRTAGLAAGLVDAAVIRSPIVAPGVRSERLTAEPRMAALADNNPLAGRASLTLADLATQPLALNTVTGSTTLALWPTGGAPTQVLTVKNTDDWLAVITAGDAVGVTVSATAAVHPNPSVRYVPLTDAPAVDVHLAWREPVSHPAVPALRRLARDVVDGAAPPPNGLPA
ncbi:LysR substrate-binding domain-containing protein [Dactylosporangium fulvum]|uniref:LysR family transcriptional regulator n=1 Tax=Dactylosporangium fulvum TaxID=53359 RepID=A0ABY5WAR7_9ACTN|nr:LysR family transcriptional regulator [Dactylosporangium fulvum]UWP87157.1 LysR family transcriptional regulator [Dactylosporangium fulvum]